MLTLAREGSNAGGRRQAPARRKRDGANFPNLPSIAFVTCNRHFTVSSGTRR
jgi:hypothetical protein